MEQIFSRMGRRISRPYFWTVAISLWAPGWEEQDFVMVKRFRCDEAAERLGLPASILNGLVDEGMIEPCESVGDTHYFQQQALDRLIHELHSRIQRASWRDMEDRMEDVERRLELLEERQLDVQSARPQSLI